MLQSFLVSVVYVIEKHLLDISPSKIQFSFTHVCFHDKANIFQRYVYNLLVSTLAVSNQL